MMKAILSLLAVAGAGLVDAQPPPVVAIRDARVVRISGPALSKATVVVRDGLIEAVGEDVPIPADAWVIDGTALTVYPGLIDGLSSWGIPSAAPAEGTSPFRRSAETPPTPGPPAATPPTALAQAQPARGPEDRPLTTSWERAADLIQASDRRLEAARNAGFTSAVTFPLRGIIAGHGAVINLAGDHARRMVVASPIGLYLALSSTGFTGGYPGSLMGTFAYIRQVWLDAEHYRQAKEDYARGAAGKKRPDYDRALDGVLEARRILFPASTAIEIDRALRFAAELKTPAVIYGLHAGYAAADLLKKNNAAVLVNLRWPEKARDANPDVEDSYRVLDLRDKAPSTPAALSKAGVRFAFYSGGIETPRDILRAARKAIDAGLAEDAALRAMTLSVAEIYGVADRLGSIDKGKIANLVVADGSLFAENTKVKYILIDGVKYEPGPETPARGEEVSR